jgi:hypothetical protein
MSPCDRMATAAVANGILTAEQGASLWEKLVAARADDGDDDDGPGWYGAVLQVLIECLVWGPCSHACMHLPRHSGRCRA